MPEKNYLGIGVPGNLFLNPLPVHLTGGDGNYSSPNGKSIETSTTLDSLFSDDFGGAAIDPTRWDVLDGGLGANPNLGFGTLTQAAIGSGTTGMTDNVASSALAVSMSTTMGAERWYLSKTTFAGKEDILVILSKSTPLASNSIFIGLVEVDPVTLVPLLNPNLAGDFTNRGGVEFGASATATAYSTQAVGDSSGSVANGSGGTASAWSTTQECLIEIDSRDITAQTALVDQTAVKAGGSRVSTQVPNDQKLYKLLMRFHNTGAPGVSATVTIQRILVVDNYEQRVQISTAEGDSVASKALAVNLVASGLSATNPIGSVALSPSASAAVAPSTFHKLTSAATTNATSVKTSAAALCGGYLRNRAASERYFKFYNKASAPAVGTDTPVLTIGIPASGQIWVADIVGAGCVRFGTGLAYAITGAYADSDATAIAAGDVDVNFIYV